MMHKFFRSSLIGFALVSTFTTAAMASAAEIQLPTSKKTVIRHDFGRTSSHVPSNVDYVIKAGDQRLKIQGMELSGRDTQSYRIDSNCPASLPAGAQCKMRITYWPTRQAIDIATATVTFAGGKTIIRLSGQAI